MKGAILCFDWLSKTVYTARYPAIFGEDDCQTYLGLLAGKFDAADSEVWVLMPNHVHFSLLPEEQGGVRRSLARVRWAYARHVHEWEERSGHCGQALVLCECAIRAYQDG